LNWAKPTVLFSSARLRVLPISAFWSMAKIERGGGGSMVTLAVCPTKSGQLTAICWWGLGWQPCQCHEDSVWGRSKMAILWKRVVEGGEFDRRGKSTGDADERSLTVNFESWRTGGPGRSSWTWWWGQRRMDGGR
jgi:hypothetical protein